MKKCICIILLVLISLFSLSSCAQKCSNCHNGTIMCEKCNGRGLKLCSSCCIDGNGKCGDCYGDGREDKTRKCSDCDGKGIFINPFNWNQYVTCSTCSGIGWIQYQDDDCWSCDSTGVCEDCKGTGLNEAKEETCEDCNGECRVDCSLCENGYIKRS